MTCLGVTQPARDGRGIQTLKAWRFPTAPRTALALGTGFRKDDFSTDEAGLVWG